MLTEEETQEARAMVKKLADLTERVSKRAKTDPEVYAYVGALMGFIQATLKEELDKR